MAFNSVGLMTYLEVAFPLFILTCIFIWLVLSCSYLEGIYINLPNNLLSTQYQSWLSTHHVQNCFHIGEIKIHLYFLSFLNMQMVQVD